MNNRATEKIPKENLFEEICRLAREKNEKALMEIINNGLSLNISNGRYCGPIELLVEEGDLESAQFLICNNKFQINRHIAIYAYARGGQADQVNNLIAQAANLVDRTVKMDRAVNGYARGGHVDQVNKLIAQGADPHVAAKGYADCKYKNSQEILRLMSFTDNEELRKLLAEYICNDVNFNASESNHAHLDSEKIQKTAGKINHIIRSHKLGYDEALSLNVKGSRAWLLQAGPELLKRHKVNADIFWFITSMVLSLSIKQAQTVFLAVAQHFIDDVRNKNLPFKNPRAFQKLAFSMGLKASGIYSHVQKLFSSADDCELYLEKVVFFKTKLSNVLQEEINRLNNFLMPTEGSKNKALQLSKKLNEINSENNAIHSFFDLLKVANTLLIDPEILFKQPVLGIFTSTSQQTTIEKKMVPFIQELFKSFSFNMDEKTDPSLYSFTTNTQLESVLNSYKKYFNEKTIDKNLTQWKNSSALQITSSIDNVPVLFKIDNSIQANSSKNTLAKSILNNIVRYFSYLLAKNISPDSAPNTLRLCLALNHMNRHWTAMIVDIKLDNSFYSKLYAYLKNIRIAELKGSTDDEAQSGCAEKYIRKFFMLEKDKEPIFDGLLLKIRPYFADLNIRHYDSMNNSFYHQNAKDNVEQFKQKCSSIFTFTRQSCLQQHGLTCGDHTMHNLVNVGLLNQSPLPINPANSATISKNLRQLTMAKNETDRQAVIDFIFNHFFTTAVDLQKPAADQSNNDAAHDKLMTLIDHYIDCINKLSPKKFEMLINIILNGEMEKLSKISLSDQVKDKLQTLYLLIEENGLSNSVQKNLFTELTIPKGSHQAVAGLVRNFIESKLSQFIAQPTNQGKNKNEQPALT